MIHAISTGLLTSLYFLWDSLFGLVFGFLVSAIVQVALTPGAMHRYLGPNLRGLLWAIGFGIISSACSYGAAAAARGFYQKGADVRPVFAFLVSFAAVLTAKSKKYDFLLDRRKARFATKYVIAVQIRIEYARRVRHGAIHVRGHAGFASNAPFRPKVSHCTGVRILTDRVALIS